MYLEFKYELTMFVKDLLFNLFLNVFSEIFKFCLVLLMAYAIALGIFYFWIEIMHHEPYLRPPARPSARLSLQAGKPPPKVPLSDLSPNVAAPTRSLANSEVQPPSTPTSSLRPNTDPLPLPYPNIVDIPSKLSVDMEKPRRKSREPQRISNSSQEADRIEDSAVVMANAVTTEDGPERYDSDATQTDNQR